MDLSSIIAAQLRTVNQPHFDQAANDHAVLRREFRRTRVLSLWRHIRVSLAGWVQGRSTDLSRSHTAPGRLG